jgi:hypothetical protein
MATTAIFIEILIIGVFSLVWLTLLLARLNFFPPNTFFTSLMQYKDWSAPILVSVFALTYLLGMVMNTVSYIFAMHVLKGQKLKESIFQGDEPGIVWATVLQKASAKVMEEISLNFAFVRVYRAAMCNFFLLGLTCFLYGSRFFWQGVLCLLVSVMFYPLWRKVFVIYYEDIKAANEAFKSIPLSKSDKP